MKKVLFLVFCFFVGLVPRVQAQDENDSLELGKIVVSAEKQEEYQDRLGSSVTVISSAQIKAKGKTSVLEALESVKGVDVVQSGPAGGLAQVYMRGANPGQTLVMIDGVAVNDPMGIDRAYNFAGLTLDNVERVEIVRGPQSPIYGSGAMAGVINIITKRGQGEPSGSLSVSGGSRSTFKQSLDFGAGKAGAAYSFAQSYFKTNGISQAAGGKEHDAYHVGTVSGRYDRSLAKHTELSLTARETYAYGDIDDGAFRDDPNYKSWLKNLIALAELKYSPADIWNGKISFSAADNRRKYRDEEDPLEPARYMSSRYNGRNDKFDWQNNFEPAEGNRITAGFDYSRDVGSAYSYSKSPSGVTTNQLDRRTVSDRGYYFQDKLSFGEKLFITPGLRTDNHDLFGDQATYKVSGLYKISRGPNIKTNIGTGFKAPTLYQLYSQYGNTLLDPEKSSSYDLGLEQRFLRDKVFAAAAYFKNHYRRLIDFDLIAYRYKNIGKAQARGWEFEGSWDVLARLSLDASLTLLATEDKLTGSELLRRPKKRFCAGVDWKFLKGGNLDLRYNYTGRRIDTDYNRVGYPTIKMKSYARVDLAVYYDVGRSFTIFSKIENLFNKNYQEVNGFNSPDQSFSAGVKAKF